MSRILSGLGLVILAFVLPMWGSGILVSDVRMLFAMAAAFILVVSQPPVTTSGIRRHWETDRATALLILTAALTIGVAASLELRFSGPRPISPIGTALGSTMLVAGLTVRIVAIRTLGAAFTSTVQRSASGLVSHGLYRYLRHPSYLGGLLAIIGIPVLFGSWLAATAGGIAMIAVYERRIRVEEHTLLSVFGADYEHYRRRTWAWIPCIR